MTHEREFKKNQSECHMQNEFKKEIGLRETNWETIIIIQGREEDVWLRTGAEGMEENRQIEDVS